MARLTRRTLLRGAAASGLVGCGPGSLGVPTGASDTGAPTRPGTGDTGAGPRRPANIVYLYADQHRGPMLGYAGHPIVQSPVLDALAAESVHFANAFTNATLCRPARATMMTGQLPHLHGSWTNDLVARADGPSHVRRIRDAGYHTAMLGKAHLTLLDGHPMDPGNVERMAQWGFAEIFELISQISCAHRPNPYSDWLVTRTPPGEPSKAARYADFVSTWEHLVNRPPDEAPWRLGPEDHVDLWLGTVAADWIRAWDGDQPFYLQINFPGPHSPYDSTTGYRARYDLDDPAFLPAILGAPQDPVSPLVQFLHGMRDLDGLGPEDSKRMLLSYYAKITMIDEAIGGVLDALAARGLLDDTWVIYGSDHGDLLGDHELWGKVAMYEGSVRVPLLIRPPGGTAGWVQRGLVDQRDVTATIEEMAGLAPEAHGTSLLGRVLGGPDAPGAQDGRTSVVAEVAGHLDGSLRTAMLRRERYKLVVDLDNGTPSDLYDLEADPEERVNRVFDPALASVVRDLRDELVAELEG